MIQPLVCIADYVITTDIGNTIHKCQLWWNWQEHCLAQEPRLSVKLMYCTSFLPSAGCSPCLLATSFRIFYFISRLTQLGSRLIRAYLLSLPLSEQNHNKHWTLILKTELWKSQSLRKTILHFEIYHFI